LTHIIRRRTYLPRAVKGVLLFEVLLGSLKLSIDKVTNPGLELCLELAHIRDKEFIQKMFHGLFLMKPLKIWGPYLILLRSIIFEVLILVVLLLLSSHWISFKLFIIGNSLRETTSLHFLYIFILRVVKNLLE
jgi:hypothetical protein